MAEALDEHIRLDKETAALEKRKESVIAIKQKNQTSIAQSERGVQRLQLRICRRVAKGCRDQA